MHGQARLTTWALAFCLGLPVFESGALADTVLLRDDFSGDKLNPAFAVTYEVREVRPGVSQVRGLLLVRYGVSWYMPSPRIAIAKYPHGVRLAADIFFYPRPGFAWGQTGNPYPLGFQDSEGGVGSNYARFTFLDSDRDRITDTIRFQTSDGARRMDTDLKGYNPATDQNFHRFAIDWTPNEVRAYFDGRLFATHKISIRKPLWVVGRNEYINVLMDDLELVKLGPNSKPPAPAASFAQKKASVVRAPPGKVRYWYFQGLGCEALRLEEMFPPSVLTATEVWSDGAKPPLPPIEYEQLIRHEVAVIANADLTVIGPAGKRLLRDYLRNGGAMLVIGGNVGYALGGWKDSVLEEMLPVRLHKNPRDLAPLANGRLRPGRPHWIIKDLDLSSGPQAQYINVVDGVRTGAETILYAGDKPFLVVWEKGGCRVACILGTPYGSAKKNYFGRQGWDNLLKRTLRWLGHRD